MANQFTLQRSTHGPTTISGGKASTFRKILYVVIAIVLIYFLYSIKFLFEERYAARQDLVFEKTGTGRPGGRRDKAMPQHLRSDAAAAAGASADYATLSQREDSIFPFNIPDISGKDINVGDTFSGKYKLLLVVNVASKWGKTKRNYEQLQALYKTYHPLGLEILAVPCNQFKHQEPGSNQEIELFARETMGAEFPIMGKTEVNGRAANDMFKHLRQKTMNGKPIKWNFAKFLVDAKGSPIVAYDHKMEPKQMEGQIKLLLAAATAEEKEKEAAR